MGFRFNFCVGLCVVLLWGTVALAASGDKDKKEIVVLVNTSARVSQTVLNRAEMEASRIFLAAGIEIAWVNCPNEPVVVEDACQVVPGSSQFVLHIVPTGKISTDTVFGMAFLAEDGRGKYCDVFFDRIEEAHRKAGADESELLGTVAAHELGHLLLGSRAYSHVGIMAPVWEEERLREIGMGHLLFTREQSSLMKARIARENLRLAALKTE